jgi:very-short-patch-repair endonuclease
MTDLVFLRALRDKLKGGNTRSIHLNVLPGRYATRLDFSNLNFIEPGLAERFLDTLLSKANFEFKISFDNINLNTISGEEQKRLGLLSKRLNSLFIENEDNFKEHGIKTFGFGYPIIIKRSKQDLNKIIKAPLFIWPLEIFKSLNKVNSWSFLRNKIKNEAGKVVDEEIHSVGLNEVLISFIKTDENISIAQINEDLLEDAVIDKAELIDTCVKVLRSLNAADANISETLLSKFNEPLAAVPDSTHFESITGNIPWIHFGGVFGLFRTQKESIITDIDRLMERFEEFDFENLEFDGFSGTPHSAIETDPSQQEILNTLGSEPKKIIQGPPGTGKSQSLTALITNALANNLKCLVVCEKKTALDVIKNNLHRENEQLGSLAAVVEDINKDRDGVVNSVRDRINSIGQSQYFNQHNYSNIRQTIESTVSILNQQHKQLDKKLYQGKSWTEVVGEFLKRQKHVEFAILKDRLDHKLFMFSKNDNELPEIISALRTAEKLFSEIKTLDHPLTVLNDEVFRQSNVVATQMNLAKISASLISSVPLLKKGISDHLEVANKWYCNEYINYSDHVKKEIAIWLAYVKGDTIEEEHKLPEAFALEIYANEKREELTNLFIAIQNITQRYKEWLGGHYHTYYLSVKNVIEEYLTFVETNCNQFGQRFLKNDVYARFITHVFSIVSGKHGKIKRNRLEVVNRIPSIKATHQVYSYFEHTYLELVGAKHLQIYVTNIEELNSATITWYNNADKLIEGHWHKIASDNLHPGYVENGNLIRQIENEFDTICKDLAQQYKIGTTLDKPQNLHVVKQRISDLLQELNTTIEQLQNFRKNYAVHRVENIQIHFETEKIFSLLKSENIVSRSLELPVNLKEAQRFVMDTETDAMIISSNLDDFRDYFNWKCFFLEQPSLYQTVIKAIIESGYEDWEKTFEAWYLNWLLSINEDKSLPKSDDKIREFIEAKGQLRNLQIRSIISSWTSRQITSLKRLQQLGFSSIGLFNKRGSRGERRNSLRKIIQTDFELFTDFYPVVMVSPTVCSSILPLQEGIFDVIIFDEASQLRLEDTFPSLIRGKIKIVSGDSQQMPPSSYFQGGSAILNPGDEDLEEDAPLIDMQNQKRAINNSLDLAESESLLVYAENCNYKQSYLKVHYRSHHPYLIDFSNHAFYGKRLIPMPAKEEYKPIRFIEVNGIYEDQVNRDEARQVVDILLHHIKPLKSGKYPSVGVATFNLYQRNLILEEITKARQLNSDYDKKINDLGSDLFVKNLENIQGDERDIIILSTTFGRKIDGSFRQMFGPILQKNGYKLLNVIITRAKYKVFVCTSIPQDYIKQYSTLLQQQKNNGRAIFYTYLAYAKAISEGDAETRSSILKQLYDNCDSKVFDIDYDALGSESPFEDEVYYRLAEKIGQNRLEQQYRIGGFKIDLIIKSEKRGEPFIAIECDGAKFHSSNEAYAWDMFRQKQLEQYGFTFYRIWSTNWWYSSEKELKKLIDFIQSEDLKERHNGNGFSETLYEDEPIVPINTQAETKKKVQHNSIVTVKTADGKALKIRFTKVQSQTNNKPDVNDITNIYDRSPLAVALFGRNEGEICQLGMLEVYYEILKIE